MSESKHDAEELLRKAREYVEKHESKRSRKSKKDKKKHSSRSREEDEHSRRRKDRDHKDSKRKKREKDSTHSKKRSKSGRHRNDASDDSLQVDFAHGRKAKEASTSTSTSKDKKRSRDKKSEDEPSKRNSRSKESWHEDGSSSSGDSDQKKDRKRQKRSKKEKDEHKSKKPKKKDKKRKETKSSSSRGSEEISKITSIIGPINDKEPKKKISADDYFTFHNHLRLFLYHKEGVYFEDLSSTETHKAFKKFCDKYNSGQLEQAYYNANLKLPDEAMEACKRTKHRWNFNTSSTEQRSLDLIKSGVKKQTEYQSNNSAPSKRSLPFPPPASAMQCLPAGGAGAQSRNNGIQKERPRPKVPERGAEPIANTDTAARDKQDAMLKMLGIKAGQKITIAPRK